MKYKKLNIVILCMVIVSLLSISVLAISKPFGSFTAIDASESYVQNVNETNTSVLFF